MILLRFFLSRHLEKPTTKLRIIVSWLLFLAALRILKVPSNLTAKSFAFYYQEYRDYPDALKTMRFIVLSVYMPIEELLEALTFTYLVYSLSRRETIKEDSALENVMGTEKGLSENKE